MRKPKKVSGMKGIVTILLAVLFFSTIVTAMWLLSFFLLVLDAIIYYSTLKENCCAKCKGKECVIALDTPMGQKISRTLKGEESSGG